MADVLIPLLILVGVGLAGIIGILVVMPFLLQLGATMEALSILIGGLGEYFDRPGLTRGCCLLTALLLFGFCVMSIIIVIALVGCFTGAVSPICGLVGR